MSGVSVLNNSMWLLKAVISFNLILGLFDGIDSVLNGFQNKWMKAIWSHMDVIKKKENEQAETITKILGKFDSG